MQYVQLSHFHFRSCAHNSLDIYPQFSSDYVWLSMAGQQCRPTRRLAPVVHYRMQRTHSASIARSTLPAVRERVLAEHTPPPRRDRQCTRDSIPPPHTSQHQGPVLTTHTPYIPTSKTSAPLSMTSASTEHLNSHHHNHLINTHSSNHQSPPRTSSNQHTTCDRFSAHAVASDRHGALPLRSTLSTRVTELCLLARSLFHIK